MFTIFTLMGGQELNYVIPNRLQTYMTSIKILWDKISKEIYLKRSKTKKKQSWPYFTNFRRHISSLEGYPQRLD